MPSATPTAASSANVLEYLRSRSSIDYDCLDPKVAAELGSFVDCTSNQWEAYMQLCNPQNRPVVKESLTLAHELQAQFTEVSLEELAVEIAMISLALRVIPLISGSIHVMCNPLYSWDSDKVFETGHRFHKIAGILQPSFDLSRLIMKVPATWEGLQACSKLKTDNVKTLATTLFTIEQAILAGEAGCISISPFVHELREYVDESYHDPQPVLPLLLEAQQYYKQHEIPTKVKSCGFMTTDEIIVSAGVDAMTLPAEVLEELAAMTDSQERLETRSVFLSAAKSASPQSTPLSYINDQVKFNRAFTTNGRGKAKTEDGIAIFCGFQVQAEELMKTAGSE